MATINKLLYLVCLLVCFTTCKKDENSTPSPHINTLSAKDNGDVFSPATIEVYKVPYASNDSVYLNIIAETSNNHALGLLVYFPGTSFSTGNFPIGDRANASYGSSGGGLSMIPAISGRVQITSLDSTTYTNGDVVNGSFDFITEDNDVISEGSFSLFVPD